MIAQLLLLNNNTLLAQQTTIPTPESYFGFKPGTDKMLFNYESLTAYLLKLDESSPMVKMIQIGKSPMGKPMYLVFISSAENINNLDRLKFINRELALNPNLTTTQVNEYVNEGKVFSLFTLSMHSNEVAPAQAAPLIAYEMVTSTDKNLTKWLNDVVYMVVPNHNPDGMNMVVDNYNKYKETKYDGASLPGLYHKYVGHDNNRDFVALTQDDTKAIAAIFNKDWFPQVMVEKHQMGSNGPRYFVSPPHDPIAENIDAGLWNWMKIFGANTITKMTDAGLTGVSQNYLFDDYWPGATETCIWKNVIGMLTEAASVKYATPIYIEPNELRVGGKGMGEYKKSINMPEPWTGGWWRLSDLVNYEIVSTMSYIETSSIYKKEILQFRNDICKKEVNKGLTEAPYYYIFPKNQADQSELVNLVNLLDEQGVNVFELDKDVQINNTSYYKGDIIVPLNQPFRSFIKEMLESQEFPARHYTPDGLLIEPYDITSWSLPLHRGVKVKEINKNFVQLKEAYKPVSIPFTWFNTKNENYTSILLTSSNNNSYKAAFTALNAGLKTEQITEDYLYNNTLVPAGSFIIYKGSNMNKVFDVLTVDPTYITGDFNAKKKAVTMPRIAFVESWFHAMDAGWTRFVLDSYGIPFKVLRPADIETADLEKTFDLIIIPDEQKSVLLDGKYSRQNEQYFMSYPPEYLKGMGKKGHEKLLKYINNGGKAIAWSDATELFSGLQSYAIDEKTTEQFEFPVKNVSEQIQKSGFQCPGSLLRIDLIKHPITYGLPSEIGVFHREGPIFRTWQPSFDVDRRVIGTFPEKDILLSGYAENEEKIGNATSIVWLKKGKGQVVLFSFSPQFRASTPGTYKLLFNSILL
ncbi:MAG: hypothetical protein A2W99_10905 [Bacteroidetes bacterium GWF2_33_16]|nr:MAG: hypothetical protein A2X00_04835 [Bacteroidetes bacterium GWE2_32_14]OFY04048.1 MAG: hypothetical protein A2W99_10905 [Bacteroidetes bacterium GWF2_33_16]